MQTRKHSRNPLDENFPHGEVLGYTYGCRRPVCPKDFTCTDAVVERNNKRRAELRAKGLYPTPMAHYRPSAPIRHLRKLREEWSLHAIAGALGMSDKAARRLIKQGKNLPANLVKNIWALNDRTLAAHAHLVPVRLIRWKVCSLHALGYGYHRLAFLFGRTAKWVKGVLDNAETGYVTQDVYQAIERAWDDLSLAVPPTGYSADATRADAARRGFLPPERYTDDGELLTEEQRCEEYEAQFAERDLEARRRLEVMSRSLRDGQSEAEIADILGIPCHRVERIRKDSKVRFYREAGGMIVPHPDCQERAQEVLEALRRWELDPVGDPYEYCRELGMMTDGSYRIDEAVLERQAA